MMNYIELLKTHNLKVTPQRVCIVENLYEYGHLNIDELYKILKSNFASISLATVYKNMHAMSEKELVEEIKIPNAKSVYELKKGEHSHLVCSKCNDIVDIKLDASSLFNEAQSQTDFILDKTSIVLSGICLDC
ncbi:MAG: transcriptional repressor, partial [Campylobacterales bacterium]|nr:transcriptional repressor [Campylobacterales bacterium]